MTQFISKILLSAIVSLFLNAPFVMGELLTRDASQLRAVFPFSLFTLMWVEMAIFTYLLISVIQSIRHGTLRDKLVVSILQIIILGIFAWAWVTLIIDQWPCFFLGGRGC